MKGVNLIKKGVNLNTALIYWILLLWINERKFGSVNMGVQALPWVEICAPAYTPKEQVEITEGTVLRSFSYVKQYVKQSWDFFTF
jgi:hypothetical protein